MGSHDEGLRERGQTQRGKGSRDMSTKTVLVVDDEDVIRRTVRKMLSNQYTVLEARDGGEGVDIAHSNHPDIILMDIMMPGMDGYQACSRIKKDPTTEAIPVIMLTGIGFDLNKELAESIGAEAYITKPFIIDELLRQIRQILGE
jgi:two-component system alkaline phosphatase synthesis response regulator PhoP